MYPEPRTRLSDPTQPRDKVLHSSRTRARVSTITGRRGVLSGSSGVGGGWRGVWEALELEDQEVFDAGPAPLEDLPPTEPAADLRVFAPPGPHNLLENLVASLACVRT